MQRNFMETPTNGHTQGLFYFGYFGKRIDIKSLYFQKCFSIFKPLKIPQFARLATGLLLY